jgi:hypothetical protein
LLLAMGGYLIAPQFANPIQDQALDLPVAALLITTALTLLYGLLHPSRRLRHGVTEVPAPIYWEEKNGIVARSALRSRQSANATAPVRYVDQARICIRREAAIRREEWPESNALRGSGGDAIRVRRR